MGTNIEEFKKTPLQVMITAEQNELYEEYKKEVKDKQGRNVTKKDFIQDTIQFGVAHQRRRLNKLRKTA